MSPGKQGSKTEKQKNRYRKHTECHKDTRQRRLEPGVGQMGQVHTESRIRLELATIITETLGFK